ncbi:MAG: signal peptidase I [Thermoanaerobaculia bacterium]
MPQKSFVRVLLQPLVIAVGLAAVTKLLLQLYVIPSASMTPTLLPGDRVVATRYWFGQTPTPGDVVVFRSPSDGSLLVKRVVAIPGDFIDSRGGRLRVGGYTLPEPYVAATAATGSIQPQVIPQERYFVLGDNRAEAIDSRSWGPVPGELIVGRARCVLWHRSTPSGVTGERPPLRVFKWIR